MSHMNHISLLGPWIHFDCRLGIASFTNQRCSVSTSTLRSAEGAVACFLFVVCFYLLVSIF